MAQESRDQAEAVEPAVAEQAETDQVTADGVTADEADPAVAEETGESVADEAVPAPRIEVAAVAGQLPPIEFNWTPITFEPLVWRYDQKSEPASIDLRDPAEETVDVRDEHRKGRKGRKARSVVAAQAERGSGDGPA